MAIMGRPVAQGAQLVGARAVILVHAGVSDARVAAFARFGAEMVRVDGTYDDCVVEAARRQRQEAGPSFPIRPGTATSAFRVS